MSIPLHESWSAVKLNPVDVDFAASILELEASGASPLSALQTVTPLYAAGDDPGVFGAREHVAMPSWDDRLPVDEDPIAEAAALYSARPWAAKARWLHDWEMKRAAVHGVKFTPGGDSFAFVAPGVQGVRPGDRKPCTEFSARSRSGMQHFTASIDKKRLALGRVLFVTLSYPAIFSLDPKAWKKNLKAFLARLERRWGERAAVIWKLEPQLRGAPHFHLMILCPFERLRIGEFRQWVAQAWFEIAGHGDERHYRQHLRRDTVQRCRSWGGVAHYVSKYLAKECAFKSDEVDEETGEKLPLKVGLYWGKRNADLWPIRRVVRTFSQDDWYRVRRVLRKREEKRRRLRGAALRAHRERWYGGARECEGFGAEPVVVGISSLRSFRLFVPGDVVHRVVSWACPFYDDGISYDEIYEFEREFARVRDLEPYAITHE